MNPNKAIWEKGDFTRIAASMLKSGEMRVAELGITPGMKVLDLSSGDGTTALPAATLGADVLGVDIASNLVGTVALFDRAIGVMSTPTTWPSGRTIGSQRQCNSRFGQVSV